MYGLRASGVCLLLAVVAALLLSNDGPQQAKPPIAGKMVSSPEDDIVFMLQAQGSVELARAKKEAGKHTRAVLAQAGGVPTDWSTLLRTHEDSFWGAQKEVETTKQAVVAATEEHEAARQRLQLAREELAAARAQAPHELSVQSCLRLSFAPFEGLRIRNIGPIWCRLVALGMPVRLTLLFAFGGGFATLAICFLLYIFTISLFPGKRNQTMQRIEDVIKPVPMNTSQETLDEARPDAVAEPQEAPEWTPLECNSLRSLERLQVLLPARERGQGCRL